MSIKWKIYVNMTRCKIIKKHITYDIWWVNDYLYSRYVSNFYDNEFVVYYNPDGFVRCWNINNIWYGLHKHITPITDISISLSPKGEQN
jgi:hypothetical protein